MTLPPIAPTVGQPRHADRDLVDLASAIRATGTIRSILFPTVEYTPELLAASVEKAKEIITGEQTVLPLNPAWTADVVAVDGRFWLDTTAAALLHPSALDQTFRVDAHEYVCQVAKQRGGLIEVIAHITVLLPPDRPIKLEVRP